MRRFNPNRRDDERSYRDQRFRPHGATGAARGPRAGRARVRPDQRDRHGRCRIGASAEVRLGPRHLGPRLHGRGRCDPDRWPGDPLQSQPGAGGHRLVGLRRRDRGDRQASQGARDASGLLRSRGQEGSGCGAHRRRLEHCLRRQPPPLRPDRAPSGHGGILHDQLSCALGEGHARADRDPPRHHDDHPRHHQHPADPRSRAQGSAPRAPAGSR